MNRRKNEPVQLVFIALSGLVLLFVVAPLVNMLIKCSPAQLLDTAIDNEVQRSIWITLFTSMGATLICSIAAIPLSYILARKTFPLKQLVNGIVDIPVVIPHSAAGIALLGIISPDSFVGRAAEKLGFSFMGGYAGIMVGMAFVSIPFLINSARDGFAGVPERPRKSRVEPGCFTIAGIFYYFNPFGLEIDSVRHYTYVG
jgi:molybdate/tungstate transport system permease protein